MKEKTKTLFINNKYLEFKFYEYKDNDFILFIKNLGESEETLKSITQYLNVSLSDKVLSKRKLPVRRKQYYATSLLLHFYDKLTYDYTFQGKPILLNDTKHISISHSKNTLAIGISPNNIGIDIEDLTLARDLKVANYVMNETELQVFNELNKDKIYFIKLWTAKECLYKILSSYYENISFKKEFVFDAFSSEITFKRIEATFKVKHIFLGNLIVGVITTNFGTMCC